MKPLPAISAAPIFAHERTSLYLRVRELHAFAAELETISGTSRYYGALVQVGLLAMFSTASAGVAPTERTRARHLGKLRDQLARFASALRGMADRGLIGADVAAFGSELVRDAESLIHDFDDALLRVQSAIAPDDRPVENRTGSVDSAPFHDEKGSSASATQRTSRGARRIRHVDSPSPARDRAETPMVHSHPERSRNPMPLAAAAHNDERVADHAGGDGVTTKPLSRRPRASQSNA
jgi:hypothetical protein